MDKEKIVCEVHCGEELEAKVLEKEDGYTVEIKGDKEEIKKKFDHCCRPFGQLKCC